MAEGGMARVVGRANFERRAIKGDGTVMPVERKTDEKTMIRVVTRATQVVGRVTKVTAVIFADPRVQAASRRIMTPRVPRVGSRTRSRRTLVPTTKPHLRAVVKVKPAVPASPMRRFPGRT